MVFVLLLSVRPSSDSLTPPIHASTHQHQVFLTASAVGYYGYDEGDRTFDESGPQGKGFLAEVTKVWEAEANKLAGKRVCRVWTG